RGYSKISRVAGRPRRIVKIAIINGPNLNLLGTREPAVYGSTTLPQIEEQLRAIAKNLTVDLTFAQYNGEGEIVSAIHALRGSADGLLLNAGAYSHTSLAIRDALTGVSIPFVEVHLTNIYAREPERRHSVLAEAAVATVCGFGAMSYELALRGLVAKLGANV
ncbi:MAG TPA: type II 3-dehydroquinate dehydratase, partial [Gemmatimonadaceae bacterium]|nr:type II 3-dehydroquinate dehydratase [Gemmatimonadaceae bacterium]